MTELPDRPLQGQFLIKMMIKVSHLSRNEQAIRCGYYSVKTGENGQSFKEANLTAFYDAVLMAKGVISPQKKQQKESNSQIDRSNQYLELPLELEFYREKLEATVKPYIKIQTQLTQKTNWWQSKIAGFPYLPRNFDYPKTEKGEYLYLLAQINFEEIPLLEGFPRRGILQFYLAKTSSYGKDFYNPTNQSGFRVLYFPEPEIEEEKIITNFDFLPTLWNSNYEEIPFYIFPSYSPHRNDCFALKFTLNFAPISHCDRQFDRLVGSDIWNILGTNNYRLKNWYQNQFVSGHKLGGYAKFTQDDPREFINEEENYILLLQIDSDDSAFEKIYIQWGELGVCNFWIKESALKKCDFSKIIYHWDCS
ncbi:MAG: YwqG family protein [Xenococcaceae cyanobacterium]